MEQISTAEQRVRIRRFPFGAVATLSCCTRGDGTSSNAPKGKPRMRTLSRNPRLFLAGHRPGAPGSGLSWNKFNIAQRARIRRFSFGAVATLSSRTRGDGTSSNAPKEKPRIRTLSHDPWLFLAGHRPGTPGKPDLFMTELLRPSIAAKSLGVLPSRAQRAVKHACARSSPRTQRFHYSCQPRYVHSRIGRARARRAVALARCLPAPVGSISSS